MACPTVRRRHAAVPGALQDHTPAPIRGSATSPSLRRGSRRPARQQLIDAPRFQLRLVPGDDLGVETRTLAVHVVLQQRFRGLEVVEGPIYWTYPRVVLHVLLLEQTLEVSEAHGVLHRNPDGRVEAEHRLDYLDGGAARGGEELVPADLRSNR